MSHHPAARRARLLAAAALAAVAAAALPTAAPAQTTTELRLEMPRPDPRLRELALRVSCSTACTIRLDRIGFVRYPSGGFGAGEQLPFGAEGPLRGTRRLPAGRTETIRFALPDRVRAFAAASVAAGEVAFASTSVTVTPAGGAAYPAVTQTAIHLTTTPNRSSAADAIAVPPAVSPGRARVRRYAISVQATQRTDWSYQRDEVKGGCKVIDNGAGWQTLRLRSPRPLVASFWHEGRLPVLSGGRQSRGFAPHAVIPVRVDAERDGVRNAGTDGPCSGDVGGGGGPATPPPACTRTGSRDLAVTLTAYSPLISAYMPIVIGERGPGVPDCPFELIGDAHDDYDVLSAYRMRNSDPTRAGDPGKFVIVENVSQTHPLEGGSARTRTRWTITFRRLR